MTDTPAQGREFCPGTTAEYVSGRRSMHWWRCTACQWVGWWTRTPVEPPTIGRHQRIPPADIEIER